MPKYGYMTYLPPLSADADSILNYVNFRNSDKLLLYRDSNVCEKHLSSLVSWLRKKSYLTGLAKINRLSLLQLTSSC